MQRLLTILLLIAGITKSFGQDTRIQEPIKNFDHLWNEFNDRYSFFEHKNINWDAIYKKYRPLINKRTTNDSLFNVCNEMLLELKDGHVGLIQYNGNRIIRKNDDGHQNVLTKKFPITIQSDPNIFQLVKLTNSTLKECNFFQFH